MELQQGVLLKGLPFSATKANIRQFFKNIEIRDNQITIIAFRNTRPTGLGFVRLKNDNEVQMALLNDHNHMENRYIEVFSSNEADLNELLLFAREEGMDPREIFRLAGKHSKRGGGSRDRSPIRKKLMTKCAYFSGLPRGYTFRHVREFFKGRLIGRNCIHLLREEGGSFRGDGYVEFGSNEECMKGLRKSGDMMHNSVMEVIPCSRDEMAKMIEEVNGPDVSEDLRSTLSSRRGHKDHKRRHTPSPVRKRMKAYAATYGGPEQEMEEYGLGYQDDQLRYHRSRREEHEERQHWRRGEGQLREIPFREPPRKEPEHMYHQYREQAVYVSPHHDPPQRPGQSRGYAQQQHLSTQYDVGNGHPSPSTQPTPSRSPERKMVRMDGLPYETSVRHILDFFSDYRLEHEQVRIQCRDDGSPSGKAFIVFSSEKFARAAVESHDKRYILGRYVEVTLV